MNDRGEIFILVYVAFLLLDLMNLWEGRDLLFDFLVGCRNRKSARKIHGEQNRWGRLTMSYIAPMLKKHKKEFRRFHMLYKILLYSLVPRYFVLVLAHILFTNAVWYIYGSYFVIQVGVAVSYRIIRGPNRISVYAQK